MSNSLFPFAEDGDAGLIGGWVQKRTTWILNPNWLDGIVIHVYLQRESIHLRAYECLQPLDALNGEKWLETPWAPYTSIIHTWVFSTFTKMAQLWSNYGWLITSLIKCQIKLPLQWQILTGQPIKFRNWQVIPFHTSMRVWLLLYVGIEVKYTQTIFSDIATEDRPNNSSCLLSCVLFHLLWSCSSLSSVLYFSREQRENDEGVENYGGIQTDTIGNDTSSPSQIVGKFSKYWHNQWKINCVSWIHLWKLESTIKGSVQKSYILL